ncbi:hypothetical protein [Nonomuraea sp. NPDC050643]|uniref:hypothetical protein n=1 Tax=Nonomuraea sp. NPDC050643 TaxID=3155660 RepID=UPI0033E7ED17
MSKTTPRAERTAGSRLWRVVALAALVVSLVAGPQRFLADSLTLPVDVLKTVDQRISVVAMFTGMTLGVAALAIAVLRLRAQKRTARTSLTATTASGTPAADQTPPRVSAENARSVIMSGDDSGIVSTAESMGNMQISAQASSLRRVHRGGDGQAVNQR